MAFPAGWPPRKANGVRSIRAFVTGTATTAYSDNAHLFASLPGANPFTPMPEVSAPALEGGDPSHTVVDTTPGGTGTALPDTRPGMGNSAPIPMIWASCLRITNTGTDELRFSFDGTNDHGIVKAGESVVYRDRYEAGIAVKAATGTTTYIVEAW